MMQEYKAGNLIDVTVDSYYPRRNKTFDKAVSNTIYSFDIEVSSLFRIDGEWKEFDYGISQEEYQEIDKASLPYIWMFGVEDLTYYGRELWDFEEVLREISDPDMYKIIWVHNLSYEFAFLLNFLSEKYTITNMCARSIKKPISFMVKELNIQFRCSYMLTNLSLDSAAKEFTSVKKRVGDLDYMQVRTPLTPLTDQEMGYCEYDIICLREIIKDFRDKYEWVYRIPLTSTGIVRKAFRDKMGFFYVRKQQGLVPSRKIYLMLMSLFAGGYTHTNCLWRAHYFLGDDPDDIIECQDINSSYPAVLVTEKYAFSEFIRCSPEQFFDKKKRNSNCFMLECHFENVRPKFYNHYLQTSKCHNLVNPIYDNGRIYSADSFDMILLDTDYDIIKMTYDCDVTITKCYKAKKDYLDPEVIKFILGLYKGKTQLKNVEGKEDIYRANKAQLNSLFGMAVTNPLKVSCECDADGIWSSKAFSNEFIDEKLDDMKHSMSTLWFYAVGCQCTAYARRNLLRVVFSSKEMDRDVVYMDTDSIYFRRREQHQDLFLSYNMEMVEKYRAVCERYPDDLNIRDFMPADKDGVIWPIGWYSLDKVCREACFLGAKIYSYRDEKGKLKITVSGVSKKGASALKDDIRNFKTGFIWGYRDSGKSTHFYAEKHLVNGAVVDGRQDEIDVKGIDGEWYHSKYRWGIVLMPTTYTLGVTQDYETFMKNALEKERRKK